MQRLNLPKIIIQVIKWERISRDPHTRPSFPVVRTISLQLSTYVSDEDDDYC